MATATQDAVQPKLEAWFWVSNDFVENAMSTVGESAVKVYAVMARHADEDGQYDRWRIRNHRGPETWGITQRPASSVALVRNFKRDSSGDGFLVEGQVVDSGVWGRMSRWAASVFLAMCYLDTKGQSAWPPDHTLASLTGCSPRRVRTAIRELQGLGLIHEGGAGK